jgi:uncharacterized protein (AIM24 family)
MQQPQGVTGLPVVVDRIGSFHVERARVASVALDRGEAWIRADAVVGRRGEVEQVGDGGLDLRLQQAFLGHGAGLDRLRGTGEVFVSAGDHDVHLVRITDDMITSNAAQLVGFTGELACTPGTLRPRAMGQRDLATTVLAGTGTVVLAAHGPPVAVPVDGHLTVARDAVAWWTGELVATVDHEPLPRHGITFRGHGLVVMQPVTPPPPRV